MSVKILWAVIKCNRHRDRLKYVRWPVPCCGKAPLRRRARTGRKCNHKNGDEKLGRMVAATSRLQFQSPARPFHFSSRRVAFVNYLCTRPVYFRQTLTEPLNSYNLNFTTSQVYFSGPNTRDATSQTPYTARIFLKSRNGVATARLHAYCTARLLQAYCTLTARLLHSYCTHTACLRHDYGAVTARL